ncbi:T9SS-translocated chitinase ChiA [Flavobacterium collinsii]|uniref:chitinase n=1 Tax=Flavobacterium collinsii TaxID=1114861 RepID=A0A9W4TL85_9FLAO|nr:T9SS-translocated chitinase ChiA [Flavobacterium collinsii]CAI2768886.1 multimodular chitinase (ChiA) precursor, comprising two glycoside hydrolase family 18 (GH18) domains [Flavobacterium collinsii]
MKHYYRLLFLLLFPLLASAQPAHGKKVVGYYAQWAIYARDFNVPKIDGSKITHLNYSFYGTTFDPARPENTKLKCLDTYADYEHTEGGIPWDAPVKGNFYDLKKLKEKYPHLKILISVGGWTKGQDLSPIAASPVARAALAADMANFIVTYPFIDGFDIDWEYPLMGGTDGTEIVNGIPVPPQKYHPDDNKNLVLLLKAMRQAMPNKLVTIAAGNNVRNVPKQYLGPNNRAQFGMTEDISTYCDYITYFGYDFGGNWYDKTCYNAPLYGSGNPNDPLYGATQSESLDELTNIYLNVVGFPANKLIMGLPFYGKKFDNVANNGTNPNLPGLFVSAPRYNVAGCTNPQNPTGTWDGPAACEKSGSIEICGLVGNPVTNSHAFLDPNTMLVTPTAAAAGWVRYFDNTTKVPYLYNSSLKQFISYEDKQSMDLKVQYIKSKNLAGGMIWELSQDTRGSIPNSLLTQVDTSFGSIVPGTVSIAGSVKNGTALVTDVTVELRNASNVVLQTVTSATGNFTFNNLTSGQNYSLTALKAAYTFIAVNLTNVTTNQTGVVIQGTQPLYTVSGTVLSNTTPATPISGVTVTATSGTTVLTAVSNATGAYSITGLTAGLNFTVTAAKTGFPYTPASTVYNVIDSNKTLNFTQGSPIVYYIVSGTILNGTTPALGVTVTATSTGATVTAVSTASGYSLSLPSGGNYTITAAAAGKTYTPASTVYTNLIADKTLNFTEFNVGTSKISGTVKNGTVPVAGAKVEIILPWTDNAHGWKSVLATTDAQGNYSFANSVVDGYTTISSLKLNAWQNNDVNYFPNNLTSFAVPATPQVYNFNTSAIARTSSYAINGKVLNGTTPVSGALVSAVSGTTTLTATTAADGSYSFANLASGSDYKVTAAKTNLTFVPVSAVSTTNSGDKTLDFTQNLVSTNLISGTVKNGTTAVSGAKIELVLPWTDNTHGWKSVIATSDAQGNFTYDNAVVAGYAQVLSLKLNGWENNGTNYYPNNLANFAMPTTPQVYNFNTQAVVVTKPVVTITAPTAPTIAINLGSAINFVATVGLSAADATTISSVSFSLNGQSLSATNSSGTYTAIWTPVANQFSLSHTLTVTATASNGTTDTKTYNFALNCSGANCPNTLPVVTWNSPSNTTVTQSSFQVVPISVTAVDSDGSVSGVTITINGGTFNMTAGTNNTYTYNFTPAAYQDYPVVIKATDNKSGVTTLNNTIKIAPVGTNRFIPLPAGKIILGYAHSWENGSAPFLYFSQMVGSKFNVVDYAFVETVNRDGYTPVLTTNDARYLTNGVFNKQLLKNDIKSLRDSGVPVIVSIGGQNGHVVLENVNQKNIFVNGLKAIIDEYQFDGVDIDFEGGSMNFSAGGLRDISYAGISAYPKLKNVVDAFKELKAHYGPGFLLTAAPETQYVQGGYSTYNDTFGSFLPIIQNLRNELDLLAVQLYNTGGENGLDGQYYGSAKRANMVTALTDMVIKGHNIGTTGMRYDGLPASKVLIALPACPSAAGSGFITPAEGINAMHYLRTGTTFSGRTYTMQPGGPYPSLRGLMTWSVNWDFSSCGNSAELSKAYAAYFAGLTAARTLPEGIETKSSTVAYFKNDALAVSSETGDIAQVEVFNTIGQALISHKNVQNNKEVLLQNYNFSIKQLFVVIVTDKAGNKKSFKVMNFLN